MSEIESLRNTVQAQNGIISRLKHELQSIEYALSDVRINNTMGAADVAHEMRCELDTLRDEIETERRLSFRNQVAELQAELDALREQIIDDLQGQFDTEGITEQDSGDALIRLSGAIAAVEYAMTAQKPGERDDPR